MIEAFVGLVGGGKTFGATRRMCEYCIRGGVVATNILFKGFDQSSGTFAADSPFVKYLKSRGWQYQDGQYTYISYDDMCDSADWFTRVKGGSSRDRRTLLVIDEATDLFDTLDRNKLSQDSIYRELFKFLRLSRHAHIDVLFICQDFFSINSRLRGLVGAIWKSTDMQHFRLPTFHVPLPFNCFMLQKFDRSGKLELYREFIAKDARIFGIYESEAFHDALGISFSGVVGDGRITGGKKMTRFQKIALFIAVLLSAFAVFRLVKQDKQLQSISKQLEDISKEQKDRPVVDQKQVMFDPLLGSPPSVNTDEYLRGEYEYSYLGRYPVLYFDGNLVKQGMITEYGKCIKITENYTLCEKDGGKVYLLPCRVESGRPPKTTAFALPDGAAPL